MKKLFQYSLILLLWLSGLSALIGGMSCGSQAGDLMKAQDNRKKIGILVFDRVLTSDVTAPVEVFGAAAEDKSFPYKVLLIAAGESLNIKTREGLRLVADVRLADSPPLDVLIVPGAYELKKMLGDPVLMNFLKTQGARAEWLASNCAGAFLLGQAGLLKGRKATTWRGGEKDLQEANPETSVQFDRSVVVHDNLITSNGGIVSYQAALILLGKMTANKELVDKVAAAISFKHINPAY